MVRNAIVVVAARAGLAGSRVGFGDSDHNQGPCRTSGFDRLGTLLARTKHETAMKTNQEITMKTNQRIGQNWGIPMTLGVLTILCGAVALFSSVLTSIVSAIMIGSVLVTVGVLEIVTAFRIRHAGPTLLYSLEGLLALVVGALFIYRPLAGMASLTLLIACYMFASGLFRGITAISGRYPGWAWDAAYGLVTVVLGLYVSASWPLSSLWVLGTVVGVEIIVRGSALVAGSWVLRDIEHAAHA